MSRDKSKIRLEEVYIYAQSAEDIIGYLRGRYAATTLRKSSWDKEMMQGDFPNKKFKVILREVVDE